MSKRSGHEVPDDRQQWTFGDALRWHLFIFGTRPKGGPQRAGKEWRLVDFASDVGRTPRSVENWLRNSNLPPSTTQIQRVLFGDNQEYEQWKIELRSLHEKASRGESSRVFIAPPEMPSYGGEILGRDEVLDRIRGLFSKRSGPGQRVVVRGLGGVGKTSLASEYVRRFGPTYDKTWWCRSETRAALLSSLAALGRLQGGDQIEPDMERAAKSALARLASEQSRWLIVFDNVPSPDQIHDLLPQAGTDLLITSRFAYWSRWAAEVELDVLSADTAASLLQQLASRTDADGALRLAALLGRLPLAIDHAAAFCQQSGLSFVGYAHKISDLIKVTPSIGSYPNSVYATFSIAIDAAIQKAPAADFLMAFLSHCGPERIPMAFVDVALHRASDPYLAIASLAEVSLIKHDPYGDGVQALTVHRLVQEVGRSRAAQTATAQSAVDLVVTCLSTSFPEDAWNEPDAWETCEQLLPHIFHIKASGIRPTAASWPSLLNNVSTYFYGRGNAKEASSFVTEATAAAKNEFGGDNGGGGTNLHNLASSLLAAGDIDGALRQVQQALVVRRSHNIARAMTLSCTVRFCITLVSS